MRCTQRIPPPGANDLHPAAKPCTREATHKLIAPNGTLIPGGLCLEHGQAVVEEYAAKLGETWTLRPVDEHGRLVIEE